MKARTSIVVVLMMACLAWAEDPARKPAPAPAKAAAAQTAKPAPAKTAAPAAARATKPAAAAPAKPAASKPAAAVANKPAAKAAPAATTKPATAKVSPMKRRKQPKAASAAKRAGAPELVARKGPLGKRDPFVSPIVARVSGPTGCATGKKCLVIDQIILRGTVKAPSGIIAVVENAARKAYFLRENDPVFNGYVAKITSDSVVFKETVVDKIGRTNQREVVKRVNAPAV